MSPSLLVLPSPFNREGYKKGKAKRAVRPRKDDERPEMQLLLPIDGLEVI